MTAHPQLEARVRRHLTHPWRTPGHGATAPVLATLLRLQALEPRPLVLDSGCGTAASSERLLALHPESRVVGLDRSEARLAPRLGGELLRVEGRMLLARCELGDFWQQAALAGLRLEAHYLLYPNPWPKPRHLGRRWHGHPAFAALLALGGRLELRCNWRVYGEEFAAALGTSGVAAELEAFRPERPISPFERKYLASGHSLYRLRALMPGRWPAACGA